MAFDLQAIYHGGTQSLSDGNPFAFDNATGLGAASIRRLAERGPQQDGDTDLGYRADPNVITLSLLLAGTSAAHLDALRGSLQAVFSPTTTPMHLRVIRDDGGTRQLDVYRTGPLDIPLMPVNRPGNLHRAVVQLKASDPVWYDPVPGTAQTIGSAAWFLGGNTIGTANVVETWENIGTAQAWTYAGTIAQGQNWTLAVRTARVTGSSPGTIQDYLFRIGSIASGIYFGWDQVLQQHVMKYHGTVPPAASEFWMTAGAHNYFFIVSGNPDFPELSGISIYSDDNPYSVGLLNRSPAQGIAGTPRLWRVNQPGSAGWGTPVPRAALYNISLTPTQRNALHQTMAAADIAESVTYTGDWRDYPVVRIYGPISSPVLTNSTTGEKLDFTGYTIGSADYYEIDLRYGYKTVKNSAGDNKLAQLSQDSDLATFHLAPASEVPDGVNVFTLAGSAGGATTLARVVYYNRYMSF